MTRSTVPLAIGGVLEYGRVDDYAGEYAVTSLVHCMFVPIWVVESWWVTPQGKTQIRIHWRSLFAGFARFWASAVAFACAAALIYGGGAGFAIAAAIAAITSALAWRHQLRGDLAKRHAVLRRAAFGTCCDVRYRRESRDQLRAKLGACERSPALVAELGARSVDEAVAAYGALVLDGHAALADRIARGAADTLPSDAPYRGEADDRVDAGSRLQVPIPLTPAELRGLRDQHRLALVALIALSLISIFG
ncbi:MAG TPA: hypothetical protein VGG28_34580, partial [Kofleriaceae bacterium]